MYNPFVPVSLKQCLVTNDSLQSSFLSVMGSSMIHSLEAMLVLQNDAQTHEHTHTHTHTHRKNLYEHAYTHTRACTH